MTATSLTRMDLAVLLVLFSILAPVLVLGARTSDRGVARRARRKRYPKGGYG